MKFIKIILFSVLFASCAFPRFSQISEAKQKLKFSEGKWVLNNIESPEGTSKKLTRLFCKKIPIDSIVFIDSLRLIYNFPYTITMNPDSIILSELRKYGKSDYLINIKTDIFDYKTKELYTAAPSGFFKRKGEATVVIYDLKYGRKIYSDKIAATIVWDTEDMSIRFAKSSEKLMYAAFRKELKVLKKH